MTELEIASYNYSGKIINKGTLYFDFDNQIMIGCSGKRYRIIDNHEFVYHIQKTQIKAIGGANGLYKTLKESSDPEHHMNRFTINLFIERT